MSDIALKTIEGCFDIEINDLNDDLVADNGLETALAISLFTDKRVTDDELPFGHKSKRGWWGDMYSEISQDKIGSRIWTLSPSKITNETLRQSEDYSREATYWLINDGLASEVNVLSEYNENRQLITKVEVVKPGGLSSKYSVIWDAQEVKEI